MKKIIQFSNDVKKMINYKLIFSLITILISSSLFAEGTPTLSPNASNITAVLSAPDLASGSYYNAPEDNRIYFNIGNFATEKLYFGFDWRQYAVGNPPPRLNNVYYRIRRPDGSVALTAIWNSTLGSAGSIDNHVQALAGPNIGGVTTGYNPLVFSPTVSGEHWIELYRSNDGGVTPLTSNADRAVGALFDMTVATSATGVKRNGRLHSDKWAFIAVSSSFGNSIIASSEPNFYAYTDDRVVLLIDFKPGFQPIAYNVSVNRYGVSETGSFETTRRSINAAVSPTLLNGFKVFLNNPDSVLYPVSSIPAAPTFLSPTITLCGPYRVNFNISEPGDVKLFFDLNGVSGFQTGTTDRMLELTGLFAGNNFIIWDGLDGFGNPVLDGASMTLTLNFLKGRFNLPLYDAELNINGFNVSSIAPVAITNSLMFWDDSLLTNIDGNCNGGNNEENVNLTGTGLNNSIIGTVSPARAWSGNGNLLQTIPAPAVGANQTDGLTCTDYGNARLLNTWGYGLVSSAVATTTFKGCSDLRVVKTVNNSTPVVGNNVTFTITASNLGISNDSNVVVSDVLPSGYTLVSATPSTGTWSAPNWTIGNFVSGANATLTIVATVSFNGNYTNTATISGTNSDPVLSNNTSSVATTPTTNTGLGFACSNKFYLTRQVTTPSNQTLLSEITIDSANNDINIATVTTYPNLLMNASFYYNGFIYAFGQNPGSNILYQLRNNGTVVAQTVSGLPAKFWNNAVCDRNGIVYLIDPGTFTMWSFNINTLVVNSTNLTGISDSPSVANFGDLIIDPTDNLLYGFYTNNSGNLRGLYRIDPSASTLTLVGGNANNTGIGSLFINASGNLYAYGSPLAGGDQNTFYSINKTSGAFTQIGTPDTPVTQSDGCDCPYRVALNLSTNVTSTDVTSCASGTFNYIFSISNSTPATLTNQSISYTIDNRLSFSFTALSLQSTLQAIYGNSVVVTISNANSGTNNVLTINNLNVPLGTTTFSTSVTTNSTTFTSGANIINTQAIWNNLPAQYGGSELSNNPNTPLPLDFTPITINFFPQPNAGADQSGVCAGSTATLTGTPNNGTWTAQSGNPTGASLGVTTSGIAVATFAANAILGTYNFIYTSQGCSDSVAINVVGCADLGVLKTVNNSNPIIGTNVTFTITAINNGPSNAIGVNVNDILPNGYSVVSVTPSIGTWTAPNWSLGSLNNGASQTLTIVATVNSTGNYANTAIISGTYTDSNTNNNSSTATPTPVSGIINAVNDNGVLINGYIGGTSFINVLVNDTLNGVLITNPALVTTTFVTSTNPNVTLSGTNVVVAAGTPAGNYILTYRICEIANPTNCDNAEVTVPVGPPTIDARNDSGSSVNGSTGGISLTNVLGNDTLNGLAVIPTQINTTFVSSTHPGITLSGTNVVVAPNTPAGSYTLTYRICEILNPTNCDTAVVTVPVTAAPIVAENDLMPSTNGASGNPSVGNVLVANGSGADTLNNNPLLNLSLITMTVQTPAVSIGGAPVPTLNTTTGVVTVPVGTPAGTYTITYQICQNLNPTNCDTAIVTVPVYVPSIMLLKDGLFSDTTSPSGVSVGDTINYNFTIINTGSSDLTNITISDSFVNVVGLPIALLSVGQSNFNNFTAQYIITQADIDAGQVDNVALVTGTPPNGPNVTDVSSDPTPCNACTPINPACTSCTITLLPNAPSIQITKDGTYVDSSAPIGVTNPGDTISYAFVVTNTGNVTLTNVVINDALTGSVNLAVAPSTLLPGQSGTATATYTITQADINVGTVYNLATVSGNP
uniref:DUF7507 domain-containing protein n=1 Tax=Flavobacterium sp. TaxID=239 RepID=UPI003750C44C